jgi:fructosamine-3-kinase
VTLPAGAPIWAQASDARSVGGGDINEAWRVTLADGSDAFVKTRADAAAGEYAAEAAGLRWLADAGALRVPRVLEVDERYLALEWIDGAGCAGLSGAGAEELGRGLAAVHAAGAACFGMPGATGARFGWLQLSNEPAEDWPTFYANRRLRPLAALGRERGALPRRASEAVERVCARLGELCGPAEPPARLHGERWSGHVLADGSGRPWLVDPSAYGGHREVDLAMLRLFGAPSPRVFAAYEEVAPLADGWEARVALYQLLALLVHALLFGGSYVAAAERVAARYA